MTRSQLNFFTASALVMSAAIVHSANVWVKTERYIGGTVVSVKEASPGEMSVHEGSIPSPPTRLDELRTKATVAADLCSVPQDTFHKLIMRESTWREHVVSSAGAVGLAQVKPSTARELSATLDVDDSFQNMLAGACLLRQFYDRRGSWRLALYDYHAGPNRKFTSTQSINYAKDILNGKVD